MRIVLKTEDGQAIKTWYEQELIPSAGDRVFLYWGGEYEEKHEYEVIRRVFVGGNFNSVICVVKYIGMYKLK